MSSKLIKILFVIGIIGIVVVAVGAKKISKSIAADLQLEAPKEKILQSREVDWMVKQPDGTFKNLGKIISYDYISDIKVGRAIFNGLNEDVSKRTGNTQFFKKDIIKGKEQWVANFYSGTPFWKDIDGKWKYVETATSTIDAFYQQTKPSVFERIIGRVFADTYYTGAGDGMLGGRSTNKSWDTAHDATTASVNRGTSTEEYGAGCYYFLYESVYYLDIMRGFYPVNTSGLPDDATISAASLKLYISSKVDDDNDAQAYLAVVQTDQPDPTVLADDDVNNCGAVDNPTKGSADHDITNIGAAAYYEFPLNATGLSWISKTGYTMLGLREGHDIEDVSLNLVADTGEAIAVRFSEYAGTDLDPYLSVTYTIPAISSIVPEEEMIEF